MSGPILTASVQFINRRKNVALQLNNKKVCCNYSAHVCAEKAQPTAPVLLRFIFKAPRKSSTQGIYIFTLLSFALQF